MFLRRSNRSSAPGRELNTGKCLPPQSNVHFWGSLRLLVGGNRASRTFPPSKADEAGFMQDARKLFCGVPRRFLCFLLSYRLFAQVERNLLIEHRLAGTYPDYCS